MIKKPIIKSSEQPPSASFSDCINLTPFTLPEAND